MEIVDEYAALDAVPVERAFVTPDLDAGVVGRVLDDALRTELVTPKRMANAMAAHFARSTSDADVARSLFSERTTQLLNDTAYVLDTMRVLAADARASGYRENVPAVVWRVVNAYAHLWLATGAAFDASTPRAAQAALDGLWRTVENVRVAVRDLSARHAKKSAAQPGGGGGSAADNTYEFNWTLTLSALQQAIVMGTLVYFVHYTLVATFGICGGADTHNGRFTLAATASGNDSVSPLGDAAVPVYSWFDALASAVTHATRREANSLQASFVNALPLLTLVTKALILSLVNRTVSTAISTAWSRRSSNRGVPSTPVVVLPPRLARARDELAAEMERVPARRDDDRPPQPARAAAATDVIRVLQRADDEQLGGGGGGGGDSAAASEQRFNDVNASVRAYMESVVTPALVNSVVNATVERITADTRESVTTIVNDALREHTARGARGFAAVSRFGDIIAPAMLEVTTREVETLRNTLRVTTCNVRELTNWIEALRDELPTRPSVPRRQ